jgi:hypothetical protein
VFGVSDCIRDGLRLAIPQPTEWQRIGNQINAAMIFTALGEALASGAGAA